MTRYGSKCILTYVASSTEQTGRPTPRKRVPAEERREDVLRVAAEVIARDGMHAASTAEIAKRAGISHAYLFRLFPTKDELLLAVSHRCVITHTPPALPPPQDH